MDHELADADKYKSGMAVHINKLITFNVHIHERKNYILLKVLHSGMQVLSLL